MSRATGRPATYSEVFADGEYRAVFGSSALSWLGDYFAKIAVPYLVLTETGSAMLAAAAFAISYLPWVVGGPLLSAVADRYPYRRVMIACDLVRMLLIGAVALPGLPVAVMLALLFAAAMCTPPFESARSALLPTILSGDRYVVALSVQATAGQLAQVSGYLAGGAATAVDPRLALILDATTFAASALLLVTGVRARPAVARHRPARGLLADTADGFRVVFTHPVLRAIALVVFTVVAVPIVSEGLAAGWAAHLGGGALTQGVLMAANPLGLALGATVVGRMLAPGRRVRLITPLALLTAAALIPALLDPTPFLAVILVALAGFGSSVLVTLNGLFVAPLPTDHRARAFGIMQGGVQILQGLAVFVTGVLATSLTIPVAIGLWGVLGFVLIAAVIATNARHLTAVSVSP